MRINSGIAKAISAIDSGSGTASTDPPRFKSYLSSPRWFASAIMPSTNGPHQQTGSCPPVNSLYCI